MQLKLDYLNKNAKNSYRSERLLVQLEFLVNLYGENRHPQMLSEAIDKVYNEFRDCGSLTNEFCVAAESSLMTLSHDCKTIEVLFAAHAHIDMNWMWGYNETAAVTIDTFRTMLDLMKEYPDFTFSQSQASVYKIVEELDSEMLREIKDRVHEGRWEVTASTWVETDKNMPSGESLSRHILYTKDYLSKLLEIPEDELQIDFEPDTFGHNANVPEIVQKGGIKYYYHCRGYDGYIAYRWRSPSGAQVLVYREPKWYNAGIEYNMLSNVPSLCNTYGVNTALKVYGVGDHGGGPTRRDIERIIDMSSWPLLPKIRFGTFKEFFKALETNIEYLPIVYEELNFVFTGCYTTQSRIKLANRYGETRLGSAEALTVMSSEWADGEISPEELHDAWQNILFIHFHDIIPGSGVIETREYASALFQRAMAKAETIATNAIRRIVDRLNTSEYIRNECVCQTTSEGSGVGFETGPNTYTFSQTDRSRGKLRIVTLFNTTQYYRKEVTTVTLWDYPGELSRLCVLDSKGNKVPFEVVDTGSHYWSHKYIKFSIEATVPPLGYSVYVVDELDRYISPKPHDEPRLDRITDDYLVLENDFIKASFCPVTMNLVYFIDKASGKELVKKPSCVFRYIRENPKFGMTSWRVGPYMSVDILNEKYPVRVGKIVSGELTKSISYEIVFGENKLNAVVSLDKLNRYLTFDIKVDWLEVGHNDTFIPQLNFHTPIAAECKGYYYEIPFGLKKRPPLNHDVPCNGIAYTDIGSGVAAMLYCDSKYGFRGYDNSLSVTLIRSACDPDRYPELGEHKIRLVFGACDFSGYEVLKLSETLRNPLYPATSYPSEGDLPLEASLVSVEGNVKLSSVKHSEDGTSIVMRIFALDSMESVKLAFACEVYDAEITDITEKHTISKASVVGNTVTFEIKPYETATLKIKLL